MAMFSPGFPDAVVYLIGQIAIEGAYYDLLLGKTLARLRGETEDIAQNEIYGRDTRWKINQIEQIPNLPPPVGKAIEASKQLLKDRNFAIHGLAGHPTDDMKSERRDFALRGDYLANPIPRDKEWLITILQCLGDRNGHLLSFLAP